MSCAVLFYETESEIWSSLDKLGTSESKTFFQFVWLFWIAFSLDYKIVKDLWNSAWRDLKSGKTINETPRLLGRYVTSILFVT